MVAIDVVYHHACLTRFYREAGSVGCDMTENYKTQVIRAHVLNELLDYIEDKRGSGTTLAMADLTSLYDKHLILARPDDTSSRSLAFRPLHHG